MSAEYSCEEYADQVVNRIFKNCGLDELLKEERQIFAVKNALYLAFSQGIGDGSEDSSLVDWVFGEVKCDDDDF